MKIKMTLKLWVPVLSFELNHSILTPSSTCTHTCTHAYTQACAHMCVHAHTHPFPLSSPCIAGEHKILPHEAFKNSEYILVTWAQLTV